METKTPKFDYSDIHWQNNGKIKLCIIVGTRPEIIRLAAVISKCRKYFDVILAHTGQNYDYNLNGIFFRDLKLAEPEVTSARPAATSSTAATSFSPQPNRTPYSSLVTPTAA